jgi:energy-coupling factor transport system ATP-binding protein
MNEAVAVAADTGKLALEGVRFAYAGARRPALLDVNFALEPGSFCGIVGPAGAGKSTLCGVLSGFVPHFYHGDFRGRVTLDGQASEDTSLADWLSLVGIVFQNPAAQLSGSRFTVFEEVAIALENAALEPDVMRARVKDVLAVVGIEGLARRSPYELSGGQQQLVALASILVMRPRVLVLDEPTAQLDPQSAHRVFGVLRAVADEGTTVMVAEHNTDLLALHATRLLALADGRLVGDGTPHEVLGSERCPPGVRRPEMAALFDWLRDVGVWSSDETLPMTLDEGVRLLAGGAPTVKVGAGGEPASPVDGRSDIIVSAQALSFAYVDDEGERTPALDDVTLEVRAGERVALVGHNGAGKSTLARHLVGLLAPAAGSVQVCGHDVTGQAGPAARYISYLFQNPDNQLFTRSVLDEVCFGPRCLGVAPAEVQRRAREALEIVALDGLEHLNPRDLDVSSRKRLALASILAMDAPVLVLDEPTGNLDARETARLVQIFEALSQQGKTIIAITHDMGFCAEHFARVVALAGGRIVADGAPGRVLADAAVREQAGLYAPATVTLAERLALWQGPDERPATRAAFLAALRAR